MAMVTLGLNQAQRGATAKLLHGHESTSEGISLRAANAGGSATTDRSSGINQQPESPTPRWGKKKVIGTTTFPFVPQNRLDIPRKQSPKRKEGNNFFSLPERKWRGSQTALGGGGVLGRT